MMVYIIDKKGKPLMPTKRHGKVNKVKWLLRKMIASLFIFLVSLSSLLAGPEDSMELVAVKRNKDDSYVNFHAGVTNLYGSQSGLEISEEEQITVSLEDFPVENSAGEFTPLFRFDFVTTTLVNANLSMSLNPFMNAGDASQVLAVRFHVDTEGVLSLPSGVSSPGAYSVLSGASYTETVADRINSGTMQWDLIKDVTAPIQLESGDQMGSYAASMTVSGRFIDSPDWTGRQWVMPVSVKLTVESGS